MALAKFFIDQSDISAGDSITLSPQESHHAFKVRRMKQGDELMLLNGIGAKVTGVIHQCDRNALVVHVSSVTQIQEPLRRVEIAVALPKGDRQKQMLDMLAQLGVASITPLLCEFSVSQYSEKIVQRWQRTLLEACKQSENPFLPEIHEAQTPLSFVDAHFANAVSSDDLIYYADIDGITPSALVFKDEPQRVSIMIGPEGGYSNSELSALQKKGIPRLKLSHYILRIEAAAVAAAAAFI